MKQGTRGLIAASFAAGAINGLFSAGGGMLLIPMLTLLTQISEEELFPTSVTIILPVCVISLIFRARHVVSALYASLPYLAGGIIGGLLAIWLSGKVPVKWLHRVLGILILWGGIRYLC